MDLCTGHLSCVALSNQESCSLLVPESIYSVRIGSIEETHYPASDWVFSAPDALDCLDAVMHHDEESSVFTRGEDGLCATSFAPGLAMATGTLYLEARGDGGNISATRITETALTRLVSYTIPAPGQFSLALALRDPCGTMPETMDTTDAQWTRAEVTRTVCDVTVEALYEATIPVELGETFTLAGVCSGRSECIEGSPQITRPANQPQPAAHPGREAAVLQTCLVVVPAAVVSLFAGAAWILI